LNGQKAYGVFIAPFSGYRNDATNGVATGDQPEGMYAVFDGTHYNGACCFDYGNAETDNLDTGDALMEALYFGLGTGYNTGAGQGPWILAGTWISLGFFYCSNSINILISPADGKSRVFILLTLQTGRSRKRLVQFKQPRSSC
jgi:hypothetical protein